MNERKRTVGRKDTVVAFAISEVRQCANDIEEYIKERESLPAHRVAELRGEWQRLGVALDAAEEMAKPCEHLWQEIGGASRPLYSDKNFRCQSCGEEMTESTPRPLEAEDCPSCHGYGHFFEDGEPTVDRRERKCLDCSGTGKR